MMVEVSVMALMIIGLREQDVNREGLMVGRFKYDSEAV